MMEKSRCLASSGDRGKRSLLIILMVGLMMILPSFGFAVGKGGTQETEKKEGTAAGKTDPEKGKLIAQIGDDELYEADVERAISRLPSRMRTTLGTEQGKYEFLKNHIAAVAIYKKARKMGLHEDPEVQSFVRDYTRQITVRKFLEDELAKRVKITPEKLKNFYEENKKDYMEKAKAKIRMFRINDKKKAEKIGASLKKGADFVRLARRHSVDKGLGKKGGLVDKWISDGGMVPGVGNIPHMHKAIFALMPGESTTEPVAIRNGYFFFRVEEMIPARQMEFSEVEKKVRKKYERVTTEEATKELIEEVLLEENVIAYIEEREFPEKEEEGE